MLLILYDKILSNYLPNDLIVIYVPQEYSGFITFEYDTGNETLPFSKERTKNILGVMVFLLIEVIGIVLINYRVRQQNAEIETTPAYTQTVRDNSNK